MTKAFRENLNFIKIPFKIGTTRQCQTNFSSLIGRCKSDDYFKPTQSDLFHSSKVNLKLKFLYGSSS